MSKLDAAGTEPTMPALHPSEIRHLSACMDPSVPPSPVQPVADTSAPEPSVVRVSASEPAPRRSNVARVAAGLIVLALAGVATNKIVRLHERDLKRQRVELRLTLAEEAAAVGEPEQARKLLADLPDASATRVAAVAEQCTRLERRRDFLRRAEKIRRDSAHPIEADSADDAIARRCQQTLAEFRVRTDPQWMRSLGDSEDVRRSAATVLATLAMRRLVAKGTAEDVRSAAREAVELIRAAEKLDGLTMGRCAIEAAAFRRLGDDVAADNALQTGQHCAAPNADDLYAIGFAAEHVQPERLSAASAYRQTLIADPAHLGAHLGRLALARRDGDGGAKATALTACLALRPREAGLFLQRAHVRYALEDFTGALEDLNAGLRMRPGDAEAHFWRGRVYFLAASWREAESDFSIARTGLAGKKAEKEATTTRASSLSELPSPTSCLTWRALARARLGEHVAAAEDAEQAVRERNDAETAWYAARTLGLCVRAARDTAPAAERDRLCERYGARSVELLRQAVAHGLTRTPGRREGLRASPDLDPVRSRRDFEDLLRAVEERQSR